MYPQYGGLGTGYQYDVSATQCSLRCRAVELDRMERSAALEDSDERDTTEAQNPPVIAFAAERRVADCSHPNSRFDLGTLDRDALVCNSPVQLILAHQCTINACSAFYCEFYSNDASSGERAAKAWQPHQHLVSCLSVCSADAQKVFATPIDQMQSALRTGSCNMTTLTINSLQE